MQETKTGNIQHELEELVSLAENVSSKISILQDRKLLAQTFSYTGAATILVFLIYCGYKYCTSTYDSDINIVLVTGIAMISSFVILLTIRINGLIKALYTEQKNLKKLLDLITIQYQLARKEMSPVSQATIDMRLNRINFDLGEEQSNITRNRLKNIQQTSQTQEATI